MHREWQYSRKPRRCLGSSKNFRVYGLGSRVQKIQLCPMLVPGSGPKGPNDPDPWGDLESRSPLRAPRNYALVVVYGTIIGAPLSRSFQGLGKVEGLWMGHSGPGGGGVGR